MSFLNKIFDLSNNTSSKSFLEKKFWTKDKIDYLPKFPIIEINHNDGDTIEVYLDIKEFIGSYNHFLFENISSKEFPTSIIDSNFNLLKLAFHKEKFNYPKYLNSIKKSEFIKILQKCELSNIYDFEELETIEEIFQKLLKKDFEYSWKI